MRLSRHTILEESQKGSLRFDPPIEPDQMDVSAVDLRLGNTFIYLNKQLEELQAAGSEIEWHVDGPWALFSEAFGNPVAIPDGEQLKLEPYQFVLGFVHEYITLPPDLAGRVEGKSGPARRGLLVHFTAPTIQAGWEGQLQLEMCNLGPAPLLLRPGQKICQLILEQGTHPEQYEGEFQAQTEPSG